ncbi:VOC family protein [Nocardia abscessus]|jgi:catechol-2,3-dioxygenase|uniref:VOC family protein n=1 Tax=Nocardia abscessus TaxID=120957 RepID=UPI0005B90809|nr:VOC family protein [Nocardia abscessus]MCC3332187.1 VOC family protein [Nocardia abscessus]
MASPVKLAHVVLRTGRLQEMTDWYVRVLEGRVAFANNMLAFMTYDDEHHRVAFIATGASERPDDVHTGLHHVAFTYESLGGLLGTYRRLKTDALEPFWCVNHGPTMSMYYQDPDGNQIELQIDSFATEAEIQAFLESDAFVTNPIGVDFDPEELISRFESGEPVAELVKRP